VCPVSGRLVLTDVADAKKVAKKKWLSGDDKRLLVVGGKGMRGRMSEEKMEDLYNSGRSKKLLAAFAMEVCIWKKLIEEPRQI